MTYDSREDTLKHINRVRELLGQIESEIGRRLRVHDASKLLSPEKEMYDEFTPKLRESTYGSDEYKGFLKDMGVALKHHYEENSHHPEHFENGINGMSLLDVVEMLADWKAAGERHEDGDIMKSMDINVKRFGISPQLFEIMINTIREMGW